MDIASVPMIDEKLAQLQRKITEYLQNPDLVQVVRNKGYIAINTQHQNSVKIEFLKSTIRISYNNEHDSLFSNHEIERTKNNVSRISVSTFDEVLQFAQAFAVIADSEIVATVDPFGCCGRYETCSDAKKCTHPDNRIASGCLYRKNLEQGKIFYGKNKNI